MSKDMLRAGDVDLGEFLFPVRLTRTAEEMLFTFNVFIDIYKGVSLRLKP